jgi:hypothetical protein
MIADTLTSGTVGSNSRGPSDFPPEVSTPAKAITRNARVAQRMVARRRCTERRSSPETVDAASGRSANTT